MRSTRAAPVCARTWSANAFNACAVSVMSPRPLPGKPEDVGLVAVGGEPGCERRVVDARDTLTCERARDDDHRILVAAAGRRRGGERCERTTDGDSRGNDGTT